MSGREQDVRLLDVRRLDVILIDVRHKIRNTVGKIQLANGSWQFAQNIATCQLPI